MASLSEHEERIREARLLVSSPEVVCAELKRYGEEAVDGFGVGDKELERNLLARGDQLINLALAEYGTDRDILGELYRRGLADPTSPLDGRYRQGLRMAVLANRATHELWGFPKAVIGEEEIRRVVVDADWSEAEALLRTRIPAKNFWSPYTSVRTHSRLSRMIAGVIWSLCPPQTPGLKSPMTPKRVQTSATGIFRKLFFAS